MEAVAGVLSAFGRAAGQSPHLGAEAGRTFGLACEKCIPMLECIT